jgi:hypothetical protein
MLAILNLKLGEHKKEEEEEKEEEVKEEDKIKDKEQLAKIKENIIVISVI